MNNPDLHIPGKNRFNGQLVNISTYERNAIIYEAPNRVTVFDEITKYISLNFLIEFFARENENICSIEFELKTKEHFFVEIHEMIIKLETFIEPNDVKIPFARGEKIYDSTLYQKTNP